MKNNNSKKLVGVKEIARRAKVSIATVDRVLNNRNGVSAKTKKKIEGIIQELDYKPNVFARRLATRKITQLAVLIPKVSKETAFWQAPLDGVLKAEEEIKNYGIRVDKYFFDLNDAGTFGKQAGLILDKSYDGVLMAPSFVKESMQFVKECRKANVPYVFIDSDLPNQGSLCYIGPNLYQSGYMAAHLFSYLLQEGSKILVINISKRMDSQQIENGFKTYFTDNGKYYEVVQADIRDTAYKAVEKHMDNILSKEGDSNAIFVTNSRVSSVARYLQEHRLDNYLVLGFDYLPQNIAYLKKDVIDFLICQKPKQQGYLGVIALYNKLIHETEGEKINFMPIDIITRENFEYYQN